MFTQIYIFQTLIKKSTLEEKYAYSVFMFILVHYRIFL